MYTAVRATSLTLANYLRQRIASDALLAPLFSSGTMEVTLNTPKEMDDNNTQGLSVWLYRVVRDEQRLNAPRPQHQPSHLGRPALPMCGHYLVTPMVASGTAQSPETEHALLGKVLQAFHDRPVLRGVDLRDDLAGSEAQIHVRLEPLDLEELTRVWEALNRAYQLSVSYEVSVVEIATAREPDSIAPVQIAEPEYSVIVASEQDEAQGGA